MAEFLGLTRAIHVACSVSLFGALLFRAAIAPAVIRHASDEAGRRLGKRLAALVAVSLGAAMLSAIALLIHQAAVMGEAHDFARAAQSLAPALLETQFGNVLLVRLALLLATAFCFRVSQTTGSRWATIAGASFSGAAVLLLAASGHTAAIEGSGRLASILPQAAHVLAAAVWLGGLVPLALTLTMPSATAAVAARRFSPIGIICVTVLAATAWVNSSAFVGSFPALVGTTYGRLALLKLALFLAMVALAAVNRILLTPRLAAQDKAAASHLRLSILAEIVLGAAIILAAGLLATTPPGVHTQPWWPFPFRLSFAPLVEQQDLFRRVGLALVATGFGTFLVFSGILFARWRWLLIPAGVVLIALVAPSFRPLAVEAFPTTFWRSPTGYSVQSVASGARLFVEHCSGCHQPQGDGGNPRGPTLFPEVADGAAGRLSLHSDGDLFWLISKGFSGGRMPGFADTLDEGSRWSIIDFLRTGTDAARLAGSAAKPATWRIPAPDFTFECPDGSFVSLSDLRGRAVHVVFAGSGWEVRRRQLAAIEPSRRTGRIATVVVAQDPSGATGDLFCTATAPEIAATYSLYRGGEASAPMGGTEILIDAGGALRIIWPPGMKRGSTDPVTLADFEKLAPPLAAPPSGSDAH